MDWELIAKIASPILLLLSVIFGLRWRQFKALLKEASEVLVALGEMGTEITKALEDDSITAEERHEIANAAKEVLDEVGDVIEAAKELVGK